eukprot:CAMPEP_0206056608 /NCGR_PEP_ID=MMETSP1466-20131121/42603_1 /ASSEMBLY_ACC=CAM_ASM_001126 /TAXON_ID=44452 /ORGANISM="Pavlova gyrans, Strain CCMP608" /LENGTH=451 /DNA_ID=CAMNT_0053431847 /DNA_START=64 /DNA_END=1420 /DNA_ORIENTATION=-
MCAQPEGPAPMAESLFNAQLGRAIAAEAVGTFFLLFIGLGAQLASEGGGQSSTSPIVAAIAFGATTFVLTHTFGHISGAHFNPAVTCTLAFTRQVHPRRALLYVIFQIVGAFVSCAFLEAVYHPDQTGSPTNTLPLLESGNKDYAAGFVSEYVLSLLVCMTFLAALDVQRNASTELSSLAIAAAVGAAYVTALPLTGCGTNPARSLAPALVWGGAAIPDLWCFLLAPLLAAGSVALVHPIVFAEMPPLNRPEPLQSVYKSKHKDMGAAWLEADMVARRETELKTISYLDAITKAEDRGENDIHPPEPGLDPADVSNIHASQVSPPSRSKSVRQGIKWPSVESDPDEDMPPRREPLDDLLYGSSAERRGPCGVRVPVSSAPHRSSHRERRTEPTAEPDVTITPPRAAPAADYPNGAHTHPSIAPGMKHTAPSALVPIPSPNILDDKTTAAHH